MVMVLIQKIIEEIGAKTPQLHIPYNDIFTKNINKRNRSIKLFK